MARSKQRKESKPRTPRTTDVAPAIAPIELSPAPVPAVVLIPTGRRLSLSRRVAVPAPLAATRAASAATSRPLSAQERRDLVARTAYLRALQQGLGRTDPVEDWLWAEREVERRLGAQSAA